MCTATLISPVASVLPFTHELADLLYHSKATIFPAGPHFLQGEGCSDRTEGWGPTDVGSSGKFPATPPAVVYISLKHSLGAECRLPLPTSTL